MSKIDLLEKEEEDAEKLRLKVYEEDTLPPESEETPDPEDVPGDVEPKPKEEEPEPPVAAVSEETWESKYKTLFGKYNAEVPRMAEDIKKWKGDAIALSKRVEELEASIETKTKESKSGTLDAALDRIAEEYPDFGKVIKELNDNHKKEIEALENKFKSTLDSRVTPIEADVVKTREENFNDDMIRAGVPNWKEIDVSPEFTAWLSQPAPYGQYTKLELLQDASRALNAPVVAKFFKDFLESKTPPKADPQPKVKKPIEDYIAPPENEVGTAPVGGGKLNLTRQMYVEFMKNSAIGRFNATKYGGRTEEQVEALFDAAIARGELK